MIVVVIVAAFAVVQSLFGVGLLVFGTPTLLLLGLPFDEVLAVLLPASMAISLLQIVTSPRPDAPFVRAFSVWCLAPVSVALALVLWLDVRTSLHALVALVLAAFVVLRQLPRVGERTRRWVVRHQRAWLLLMGVVHGVSNLGGGLLTILASSRSRDKAEIRGAIAFCYACFVMIQLAVLAAIAPRVFGLRQLGYAAISTAVYLLVGQQAFRWVSAPVFDRLFTALMALYAGLLGLRSAGVL